PPQCERKSHRSLAERNSRPPQKRLFRHAPKGAARPAAALSPPPRHTGFPAPSIAAKKGFSPRLL
ncbi:MAG TPA: hypothetical protein PLD98_04545, partial [Clostridiales bacterium]|nr:hypothetical protein [Clostridiales bacterium]